ncbi:AAA family ATPase [uncultured Sunxiuqinia sp.]|uniref:AAA family ATPase n=1 Tax=uncultured Sunxiuqinia sp. TaxID=1573825 RepID=UPI00260962B1|nr:AAA family ATPase [uncultured Sunxiuqinia sp.]
MLIKRIKAKNFKTYLDLDLDISTEPDRPIVLIGGANGGGKTTFFDAIYGALYGLKISTSKHFKELLNAGALGVEEEKIQLELHFSGKVLNQEQSYVLTRTYMLNPESKPVESVRLNMNGTIFQYGSATPIAQRAEQEAQVNKIIKANLPEELSRYFLFDAMEAGSLLKEDRLNRVIKENIENVMGFNKYLSLANVSEKLTQDYTAQRLDLEKEKKEYLELITKKSKLTEDLNLKKDELQMALAYSVSNKEMYDKLKAGFNQESTINNKIAQLETDLDNLHKREKLYKDEANEFASNIENHICLPKLASAFKNEISLVFKERNDTGSYSAEQVSNHLLEDVISKAINYLTESGYQLSGVSVTEVSEIVLKRLKENDTSLKYDFFEPSELRALEKLASENYNNPFPGLQQKKIEMDISIANATKIEQQIRDLKEQVSGNDFSILKAYEDNESKIKRLESEEKDLKKEIEKIQKKIHTYDIPTNEEPDPKFELLKRLQPFFEKVANTLLKSKKEQIQSKMKEDLNANLAAYKDVISRVELSEDLKDLNFSIYHKSGNEIYLSQLNTASTQVVVQVLLKALHEYGDYDPPVMIDTVMGVLDETSRSTLLENYFPELSHQTILLSSDSEIRPSTDLVKIEPFISKTFTLNRDKELQKTHIAEGYFNQHIN